MKILVIGGEGTIGKRVCESLSEEHLILTAGRNSGKMHADISSISSIEQLFKQTGRVDAIVSIAGEAKWDMLENLTEEDFYEGIKSKLMGQINLVRVGKNFISEQGSITLTSGVLADDPVKMSTIAAMVNGGLHSFVKALAKETSKQYRVNVVSAEVVEDAYEKYKDYFPGHTPVSMQKVVRAYRRSIEGRLNGEIIKVYN